MKWIFSYRTSIYDLDNAIKELDSIDWDIQNFKVEVGDEVYLYSASPEQAIFYKCVVVETGMEETTSDDEPYGGNAPGLPGRFAKLVLDTEFVLPGITYKELLEHGVKWGPLTKRKIVEPELIAFLEEFENNPDNIWTEEDERNAEEQDEIEKKDNVEELDDVSQLRGGEREVVVKARINQSAFKKQLIKKYQHCCLCGISNPALLVASHIKPWSKSGKKQKVDVANGLLLCPNHDKLFDSGFISFAENGKIMISNRLSAADKKQLGVDAKTKIIISEATQKYMKYHRDKIFR